MPAVDAGFWPRLVPDPIFGHPRLVAIHGALDPDRSELEVYGAVGRTDGDTAVTGAVGSNLRQRAHGAWRRWSSHPPSGTACWPWVRARRADHPSNRRQSMPKSEPSQTLPGRAFGRLTAD